MNLREMLDLTRAEERELDHLERQLRDADAWLDDEALLRLPHPARIAAHPGTAPAIQMLTLAEPKNQAKVKAHLCSGVRSLDIFEELTATDDRRTPIYHAIHAGAAAAAGGYGSGTAGPSLHSMRFALCGGRIYSFTDDLVQLLQKTKLSTDIPVSELRLPAPNIYIEVGTNRAQPPLFVHNAESGDHPMEGAYVSAVKSRDGQPWLEVTFTGSPVGHGHLMDDAVDWASMRAGGDISISQALIEAHTRSQTPEVHNAYFDDQARLLERAREWMPRLELIVKCILFLAMPEAQRQEVLEGTEARKSLMRAQSGAHRRKAARAVARAYDRILVSAAPAPSGDTAGESRSRATHWRDGHFRNQRHGPALSLTKVIWIRPVLVNAGALGDEV